MLFEDTGEVLEFVSSGVREFGSSGVWEFGGGSLFALHAPLTDAPA